ncbi:MAG: hypothetical protein RR253_04670 [Oscillospiraceae bacterium]
MAKSRADISPLAKLRADITRFTKSRADITLTYKIIKLFSIGAAVADE